MLNFLANYHVSQMVDNTFTLENYLGFVRDHQTAYRSFVQAAKLSGARFSVLWGAGARLEVPLLVVVGEEGLGTAGSSTGSKRSWALPRRCRSAAAQLRVRFVAW